MQGKSTCPLEIDQMAEKGKDPSAQEAELAPESAGEE